MSIKHLQKGEPLPALRDGSLRLYSMKYCPYAQRPRLVLHTKGVKYEEINCNLKNKPEFLLERHPDGKVPVLELDGKVVIESNAICDLLDELYPDPPLYPKDPFKKAADKAVMEMFASKVISGFHKAIRTMGEDEKVAARVLNGLTEFEAELKKRGTPFFGGYRPGMIDYNTWPFNERLRISDKLCQAMKTKLPTLEAYFQRMVTSPSVAALINSKDVHLQFYAGYLTGDVVYDFEPEPDQRRAGSVNHSTSKL